MSKRTRRYVFPEWANYLLPAAVIIIVGAAFYIPFVLLLAGSQATTDVGYAPQQPIPFSHKLHVGTLKMDCRTCHTSVEDGSFASLPTTQTCMSCHATINADSPLLAPLRESHETGEPIRWRKVHDLPDHAYFNHAAHVAAGVGCTTCHGPIDEMDIVRQATTLSMASCLQCHRQPELFIRPREAVTRTDWDPLAETGKTQEQLGRELVEQYEIRPRHVMENCSTCHR